VIGLLAPVLIAAVLTLAAGGSVSGWSRQRVRWAPLTLGALVVQVALFSPPIDEQGWVLAWGAWVWVASMLAVFAMLFRNALVARGGLRAAWVVAALGVAANVLVVSANAGYMPRTVPLRPTVDGQGTHLSNVVAADADAPLVWLGDVIEQPDWIPLANAVSIGDVLLSAGLTWWVAAAGLSTRTTLVGRRRRTELGVPSG
jgi:hypothetical protein